MHACIIISTTLTEFQKGIQKHINRNKFSLVITLHTPLEKGRFIETEFKFLLGSLEIH